MDRACFSLTLISMRESLDEAGCWLVMIGGLTRTSRYRDIPRKACHTASAV